jgi:hypothetical protein
MSTKTTFKRVALVAVASLGFGVLTSVAPASAAGLGVTPASISAGTPSAARIGIVSKTSITIPMATATEATDTTTVRATVTSAPTGSAYNGISTGIADFATGVTASGSAIAAVMTLTQSTTANAGTFAAVGGPADKSATVGYVYTYGSYDAGTTVRAGSATLNFTPDIAGTYTILISAGTGANTTKSTNGDVSTSITITTAGIPTAITTAVTGKVVNNATHGAVIAISLKDSNGNATVLGLNESLNLTKTTASAITLSAPSLGSGTTNTKGVYFVTATDGGTIATGADVITIAGGLTLPSTLTTNTSVSTVNATTAAGTLDLTDATGYAGTAPYKSAGASHGFTLTLTTAPTAATNYPVDVVVTGGLSYATNIAVAADKKTGTVTVSQALGSTTTAVSVTSGSAVVINYEKAALTTAAVQGQSAVLSATAGKNTFTVLASDQYGAKLQYAAVSVSVAGRNTVASTSVGVTDANGLISYSLTDAGTTGTKDTFSFVASAGAVTLPAVTATVTYGTVTVSTVTVTGGATADTVAGTTTTNIGAGDNGPEASAVAIKAVIKDASGNLLAGVPVVFTVDKGLIVKTAAVDFATVYTGSDGSATTKAFNWMPGTQTVTATAGGVAKTGIINWVAYDASSARVLSATATGDIVTLKVVDRFGNPVKGVAIDLSRTGTGLFGSGKSTDTATTDKSGTADIRFTGTGSVVAELDTATYTQAADKAGEIDATAVTAAVAGTTKGTGASLAPAGVAKVTIAIEESANSTLAAAQSASDAAAEATDAANAATDAANAAAEAADAATAAAQDAADAVAALSTQVTEMVNALKKQITALTNLVIKIQKKVKA